MTSSQDSLLPDVPDKSEDQVRIREALKALHYHRKTISDHYHVAAVERVIAILEDGRT